MNTGSWEILKISDNNQEIWSFPVAGEKKMIELGRLLAAYVKPGDVIYISGQLGAGKTTLVRGISRGLGYMGRVTSPTFTLMNAYPHSPPLYHLDFYRLEAAEIHDLGLEDILERDGVCMIEWPVVVEGLLPNEGFFIQIGVVDGDYEKPRFLEIKAAGREYARRLKEMKKHAGSGY